LANGAPPPPPPPPPKPQGKTTGERGIFDRFINSHTALKPYAGQIWADANNAGGITPTELAATLWLESRGNPSASNPSGALGLAQILDTSANPTNAAGVPFFRANRQISRQDKLNPSFAIQYMAWRMSGAVQKYGSLDVAYVKGYNPNFTGTGPSGFLPKGYVGTPNQTVKQTVTKSQQTAGLKNTLNDPWVVETKAGFKYVNSPEPPKGTVSYGGQPITRSEFTQVWKQTYADTFFAYTGRSAKPSEIVQILQNAPSVYSLGNQLASEKAFSNSPVYKKAAPGLVQYARTILGENWKPSGGIIREAIAQNWDQSTFYAHLRQQPAYQNGPEFKTNLAQNQKVFEDIYGNADLHDPSIATLLKQKTLAGWTADQLNAWLRQQPAYKSSAEAQAKNVNFLSQLGLVTGAVPTLSGDQVDALLNPQFPTQQGTTPPGPVDNTSTDSSTSGPNYGRTKAKTPFQPTPTNFASEHGQGGGFR
jgi:hypothetical protein